MSKVKPLTSQAKLNADQQKAIDLASYGTKFHLFYGGGGSGKSFLILYIMLVRALNAPGSRHIAFRLTADSCRRTLFDKTLRETFEATYPGLLARCKISESEMHVTLPNGSMIFFNGLNDEARMTKVLGDEFATIWFNECNEFGYHHVSILLGRLRQRKATLDGRILRNKMFFDCNPASKKSWEYQAFIEKVNPIDGNALEKPDEWVHAKLRPEANIERLGEDYLVTMAATMSAADRKRYLEGEWASENENALFKQSDIDGARRPVPANSTVDERIALIPPLKRIVVAVDPAASNNKRSDETGIVVAGVDKDDEAYVLADYSMKGTPEQWAAKVAWAFQLWQADRVVAEKNQGGLMVETTLRMCAPNLPYTGVHASRGKEVRAEPVSALYERRRVHHVGSLPELETQMVEFGLPGVTKSPDRMDALVWAITELCNINASRTGVSKHRKARGFWR